MVAEARKLGVSTDTGERDRYYTVTITQSAFGSGTGDNNGGGINPKVALDYGTAQLSAQAYCDTPYCRRSPDWPAQTDYAQNHLVFGPRPQRVTARPSQSGSHLSRSAHSGRTHPPLRSCTQSHRFSRYPARTPASNLRNR